MIKHRGVAFNRDGQLDIPLHVYLIPAAVDYIVHINNITAVDAQKIFRQLFFDIADHLLDLKAALQAFYLAFPVLSLNIEYAVQINIVIAAGRVLEFYTLGLFPVLPDLFVDQLIGFLSNGKGEILVFSKQVIRRVGHMHKDDL